MKRVRGFAVLALTMVLTAGCIGFAGCSRNVNDGPEENTVTYIEASEYYAGGKNSNPVIGMDRLGRTFEATRGEKNDKSRDVGIFYFLCSGQHGSTSVVNVSELLEEEGGLEKMFLDKSYKFPGNPAYYWGEPLFGYYNSSDSWVIRRHLEMLGAAGVDFLVFDVTNAVTYDIVAAKIAAEVKKLKEAGREDCPELVFYTASYTHTVIRDLYDKFYKQGKYDSAWYRIDGKPLIIGRIDMDDDLSEARGRGDLNYSPEPFGDEIENYFYFRECQWPTEEFRENGFPWIEFTYPAPVHNGVINVAVSAHPCLPMSLSVTEGADNWGRGWNVKTLKNESDKAAEGQFFQSTWDVALKEDPAIVFVTGWNEWTAGRIEYGDGYAMVDQCNTEFSRDAEPMKGGHMDNFYIQLAANIRAYKNVPLGNARVKTDMITMDISSDSSEWNSVHAVFGTAMVVNKARNSAGGASSVKYTAPAARNFINEVRICEDSDNYYFRIQTEDTLVLRENGETSWMNIFIGTGKLEKKGWEGYEYVIGRRENGNTLSVEKLSADFSVADAGLAGYNVTGNVMLVKVPKTVIGTDSFYFKIADGIEVENDIMDYYVSGRSFPIGALSFRYAG